MRYVIAALAFGLFTQAAAPGPAAAASRLDEATAAVNRQIDKLGIDRSRIKSIFIAPDDHPKYGPVPSYTGWISFTDCRGNLVIDLSQTDAIRTQYSTGDCKVPGVD